MKTITDGGGKLKFSRLLWVELPENTRIKLCVFKIVMFAILSIFLSIDHLE